MDDHQNWDNFKEHLRFAYKVLKHTGALTVHEAIDRDEVMNLVTTVITKAFSSLQEDTTSMSDNQSTYDSIPPPPLMDTTPEALVMNSTTSTVSDLTLQTLQQQM